MTDTKTLREMQAKLLSIAEDRQSWRPEFMPWLCGQLAVLSGHLADMMIPIPPQPPCDDEHVAVGCRLFSDPAVFRC